MEKQPEDSTERERGPSGDGGRRFLLPVVILVSLILLMLYSQLTGPKPLNDYAFFVKLVEEGKVKRVEFTEGKLNGEFQVDKNKKTGIKGPDGKELSRYFYVNISSSSSADEELRELFTKHGVKFSYPEPNNALFFLYLLMFAVPIVLLIFLWTTMRRSKDQFMGGGFLSGFTRSPAKRYEGKRQGTTFDDVAGLEGVKADLNEIVEFLKDPGRFERLGGRIPKGVLLNGPPGTGKTLLARAVAGEADVPFYTVNGSEFIQMFVGVGASRVRDLFKNAKETAPSIIFIDEIDAVGRQRGAGLGGGHDEREQTLNQILSEMDGFEPTDSVIIMAATNRPDVLDPALLRPGRFDRHVNVNRPTRKGRLEILRVHVRDVPLDSDVDLEAIAANTAGMTGAGLENLVNEAALWAARHEKNRVTMSDFEYSRDKVLMGAKREEVLSAGEKEKTAFHEAGHTLLAWYLPHADEVYKVTIIPRGQTLGATQIMPSEERLNMSEAQIRDHLVVLLGGRAAEKLIFQETTVGAENDLERATGLARRMVTHWGMSQRLGPVSYKMADDDPFLGREIHQQRQFSEHTMETIDSEVVHILKDAEQKADELLKQNQDKLDSLSQSLIEKEELEKSEIREILGATARETNAQLDESTSSDQPSLADD